MTFLINPFRFVAPVISADRWRLVALSSDVGAQSVGELELATTVGGTNIAPTGTASVLNSSGSGAGLNDGVLTGAGFSAAASQNNDRFAMQILLPSPLRVAEFRLRSRADLSWQETPKVAFTQTSQDGGATWRSVDLWFNNTDWTAGESRSIVVGSILLPIGLGRSNARGWRCRITSVNGAVPPMIGELAFAASTGGANICTGGVAFASSGSPFGDRHPRAAFDGTAATRWNGSTAGPTGEWRLGYARQTPLGNAVEARITLSSNAGETQQAPLTGFFDWTEDWWTWTQAAAFTISSPTTGTTYTFAI